ncbi:MAG TPA: SLBB domain-containing protein [Candidatus Rifleibacterium sp.]|nr:SLBB domain-containing protein [Candidatus Rifleibacterium sp.]HPT47311.1 SLBB domain-containing protein [Candidatus Rifleibacterium sp.]
MKRIGMMVLMLSSVASAAPAQNAGQLARGIEKTEAVIVEAEETAKLDKNSPEYIRRRLSELEKTLYEKTRNEVIAEKSAAVTVKGTAASKSFYNEKDELTERVQIPNQFEIEKEVQKRLATESLLKNFGREFFEEGELIKSSLFSGLAPSNYQLGPGDELKIIIWSELGDETVYDVQVNPEGQIYVPIIGVLGVSGLTVGEFEQTVLGQLSGKFKHFKGQATLTKVRTIQIFVVGEVEKPGAMNVSGLATAFSALYQAGGPTQRGSMRRINVLDSSGKAKSIDLYRYLLSGDRTQDIAVKNGDTIFVPTAETRITVTGMVSRPAIYELIGATSLSDVLEMAGRVLPKAYSGRAMVTRWTGDRRRESFDIKLSDAEALKKFKILNGDEVKIEQATEMVGNQVNLEGPVVRPGEYSVDEELTVAELINRAGGIIKEDANLERGQIYRKGDGGQQQVLTFNVRFALAGDKSQNHVLKPFDRVRLFAENEITADISRISIDGAIRRPGQYVYRDGMKLADLVVKAQGLSLDAADEIEIARVKEDSSSEIIKASIKAALADEKSPDNIVLQPLDRVSILARGDSLIEPEVVVLKGQVKRPGPYALTHRGERLSSLIERAGGLTSMAFAEGTVFMRKIDHVTSEKQLETTETVQDDLFRQATLDLRADLLRSGAKVDDLVTLRSEVEGEKVKEQVAGDLVTVPAKSAQELTSEQSSGYAGIEMSTRSMKNQMLRIPIPMKKIVERQANEYEDIALLDGDQITIPVQPTTVSVFGSVMNPTTILYNPGNSAGYYINRAGGFNGHSDHRRTIVVRANGEVLRMRNIKKVERGDIILVPPKPKLIRPDPLKELSNIAGIIGNMAVTYKVIDDNK